MSDGRREILARTGISGMAVIERTTFEAQCCFLRVHTYFVLNVFQVNFIEKMLLAYHEVSVKWKVDKTVPRDTPTLLSTP